MQKYRFFKLMIAAALTCSYLPVTNAFALESSESGITDISAVSDVSWCGNIPGYGTYPQRSISTIYLTYSDEVDGSKLDTDSYTVVDQLYPDEEINIEDISVSGKTVTLEVETETSAGVLTAPGGNFRRYINDFTVTSQVDVYNLVKEVISLKGSQIEFHDEDITHIASDEFQDYIVKSENSDNNIYVKYYLPENYDENRLYPMVVHHTGGGQHYRTDTPDAVLYGSDNFGVELDIDLVPKTFSVEAPEDTIVITIQCLANNKPENYSPGKDINQIVHYFMDNYAVDADRIYAIGNSQGGIDLSEAVYLEPDLYAAYLPCNTSIVSGDKSSEDTEAYQLTVEYCQAYVDQEVAIWFHRGENDFTGPYSEVTIPYNILIDLYQEAGYSEEEISQLVKQTMYTNADFEALGSTYYHGATGLMCLNQDAITWLYQQTKTDNNLTLVHQVDYEQSVIYQYDAKNKMDETTTNVTYTPSYLIFPDQSLDAKEADQLLTDLGLITHLDTYATQAFIINPIQDQYASEDVQVYLDVIDNIVGPNPNLKVIALGNGATFFNQYLSQYDWPVAGIMLYGGETGVTPKYSVPAYISNASMNTVKMYIESNLASHVDTDGNLTTYTNPNNSYEKVVYQANQENLNQAFQNAWTYIFSQNARIGNIGGTFYSMIPSEERTFQYVDFVTPKSLNITRKVVVEDLNDNGQNSLWYEYLPAQTLKANEGTVPVVLLLHGNGNDPRTQFESSGWAQVAADNGIILIEPEWQGSTIGGYAFEAMTTNDSSSKDNDIITMLNRVFEKYPQIDKSRVYVEGLSRGGLNSIDLGLLYPEVFAGVGIHSSGIADNLVDFDQVATIANQNAEQYDMPVYFVTGAMDHNHFVPFYGEDVDVSAYNAIRLYMQLNDMNVIDRESLKQEDNPYFGMILENYGAIPNEGLCQMYGGTLTNDNQVAISLNVVDDWGHWNYEFDAQMMWNFFKQYQRDTETKEIIFTGESVDEETKNPSDEDTTDSIVDIEETSDNPKEPSESNETPTDVVHTSDMSMINLYITMCMITLVMGLITLGVQKKKIL